MYIYIYMCVYIQKAAAHRCRPPPLSLLLLGRRAVRPRVRLSASVCGAPFSAPATPHA